MNRINSLLLTVIFCSIGCNTSETQTQSSADTTMSSSRVSKPKEETTAPKKYSNERFKDIIVMKIAEDSFNISGKAQVFEAAFSWIIEDGNEEVAKGFQMTNAGAPEWGDFNFGIRSPKGKENSTLHLILFEASPKDGSRQYELAIPLN
jgi:hypothetical protein